MARGGAKIPKRRIPIIPGEIPVLCTHSSAEESEKKQQRNRGTEECDVYRGTEECDVHRGQSTDELEPLEVLRKEADRPPGWFPREGTSVRDGNPPDPSQSLTTLGGSR